MNLVSGLGLWWETMLVVAIAHALRKVTQTVYSTPDHLHMSRW